MVLFFFCCFLQIKELAINSLINVPWHLFDCDNFFFGLICLVWLLGGSSDFHQRALVLQHVVFNV